MTSMAPMRRTLSKTSGSPDQAPHHAHADRHPCQVGLVVRADLLQGLGSPSDHHRVVVLPGGDPHRHRILTRRGGQHLRCELGMRSEEHTSELQSLMRISYAVFCLKKKIKVND